MTPPGMNLTMMYYEIPAAQSKILQVHKALGLPVSTEPKSQPLLESLLCGSYGKCPRSLGSMIIPGLLLSPISLASVFLSDNLKGVLKHSFLFPQWDNGF